MSSRSWWGWGTEGAALTADELDLVGAVVAQRMGRPLEPPRDPPPAEALDLPPSRVTPPASLADLVTADHRSRARHSYGRAFRDVVRALDGRIDHPTDLVARPRHEDDVVALLDWCSEAGIAAIPYGGGSSVVGGVEPAVGEAFAGAVTIDLTRLDRVLEVDRVSRAARIQAGVLGPHLEDQLRPHGLTLRHFPQSFEFSSLGGWLATRAGGHYASVYTHIDDFVESMRVVTPAGISESRRLPGSGAGPSPDRLLLGSEGAFGVISEAWMRVQDRPVHKAAAGVRFVEGSRAVAATRAIAQSGLFPTNCRLLDADEAALSAGIADGSHLLVLGFESADHPVDAWIERATAIACELGGTVPEGVTVRRPPEPGREPDRGAGADGAVGAWRQTFLRAPYLRDGLARMGAVVETFETACTWDRFPDLDAQVRAAVGTALEEICGGGVVTCRFTHVYPDGPAPYYSVIAPGRTGSQLSQWDEVKAAASEALLAAGGTITHHHGVGRVHDPWYRRQRPRVVGAALAAAKTAFDPAGICNPGVIV